MEDLSQPAPNFDNPSPEGWEELPPPLPPLGILSSLNDQSLTNLASYGEYQQCPVGTVIIKEGEPQDRFFVVVVGKLSISALASGNRGPPRLPSRCWSRQLSGA